MRARPTNEPQRNSVRERPWLLIGLCSALFAATTIGVPLGSFSGSGGPWREGSFYDECQLEELICAEWPFDDGRVLVCCIEPLDLGTMKSPRRACRIPLSIGGRDPDERFRSSR